MAITCLNECVFQVGLPPPPAHTAPVQPNGQSIVHVWSFEYPNGRETILPLHPWPPRPGWPGQAPGDSD